MNQIRIWLGDLIKASLASGNKHQAAKLTVVAKDYDNQADQIKMLRDAFERQLIDGDKAKLSGDGGFDDVWKLIAQEALAATEAKS